MYWWWSKWLKNLICHKRWFRSGEGHKGPFYCGISRVMMLRKFSVSLKSPTSTSVHIEVAMKFTGDGDGMIIEMDSYDGKAVSMGVYDCSWISRYKEEDERYDVF